MTARVKLAIYACLTFLTVTTWLTGTVAQDESRGAKVFQQLDANGDERITPNELSISQAFSILDRDGDSTITAPEAREAVSEMTPDNRQKLGAAIESVLRKKKGEPNTEPVPTDYRASYSKNLRIHVGVLGVADGEPLTEGDDFKPSWSKTGDKLVFFRRVVNDRVTSNWKTAIHIINVDGTGLHKLSDGTHTDFNQTWTRDGTNTPIWNRKRPDGGYMVMASKIGAKPGEEYLISDPNGHTWAYSCLTDGRILVSAKTPDHPRRGYYLMTPDADGKPTYEPIVCELAKTGILDRVSISPSETKVCSEYQKGFVYNMGGRTLYVADFDAKKRTITDAKPFANEEGKPVWFAYPRWTKDETSIVYHAGGKLYLYTPRDGSTKKVSIDDKASYIYPHGEATPK